jgi:hypothetical protein
MTKNVQMAKKVSAPVRNHGVLLRALYHWSEERSMKSFAERFNRSRQWMANALHWERIPQKELVAISKALNVPLEYWNGTIKLDELQRVVAESQQSQSLEVTGKLIAEKEHRIMELQQMVIELQSELLRLREELRAKRN